MTLHNPASGNDPALPEGHDALFDLLSEAVRLEGLIDALFILYDDEIKDGQNAFLLVLEAAKRMAKGLSDELDRQSIARARRTQ